MNPRIGGLFRLSAIGFALLISITAYWQIWAASGLAARQDNARLVYRQLQIKRGVIYAADGHTVIASSIKRHRNGLDIYLRKYPLGPLFGHPVGYNTIGSGRSGLELSENDYLTSSNADLSTVLGNLGDRLQGQTVTGNNIVTSLSVPAQRAALAGLAGHSGAVVAIEPSTGRVLAMGSSPTYNPTTVASNFSQLNSTSRGSPLLNRATQGLYAPGSTFKVVTATAALESGKYTPQTTIDGHGSCLQDVQGQPLCNAGQESAGVVTLTDALTFSYNTVFAQVGQQVGVSRMFATMDAFGFFTDPPLDYPSDEMNPSGLYTGGHLLRRSAPVDIARVAIGQERLGVTPMQMAEVAATVANHGVRMRPSLVDRVTSPGGATVTQTRSEELQRVMSATTASELTDMMRRVVEEGTGQEANLGSLSVAGKTGTAETGVTGLNTAWFIAFAPAQNPRIAIAVVIERTPEFGGTIAAPIARDVITAYLGSSVAK
jgi:peptidoglycan glycosyltransferase